MTAKKILMIVGDFVEDYEAMVPFQMLVMVGHHVHTVSPGKKKGDSVKTAIHDFEGDQTYTEKPGHRFAIDHNFEGVKSADYDALVIPGGRAPEFLRLDPNVIRLVKEFFADKKPVAALCHGPQILAAADVLSGFTCTAYPALKPEVERAGGKWSEPAADSANAVTDRNLVSAVAWPGHPEWIRQFLVLLGTKIEV